MMRKQKEIDMIKSGNKVRWVSAAGTLEGTVKSIKEGKNAAGDMIPWVTISYSTDMNPRGCTARFAATDSNLKMMKLEVLENKMLTRIAEFVSLLALFAVAYMAMVVF